MGKPVTYEDIASVVDSLPKLHDAPTPPPLDLVDKGLGGPTRQIRRCQRCGEWMDVTPPAPHRESLLGFIWRKLTRRRPPILNPKGHGVAKFCPPFPRPTEAEAAK